MSHTVTTKVKFAQPAAGEAGKESPLAKAVVRLGGKFLGQGNHKLYQGTETGAGFTLPEWRYPIVLSPSGELKYDDYHGSWGNVKDLGRLQDFYAVEAARAAANERGLMVQETAEGGLQIYSGGAIVNVSPKGEIDVTGAMGVSCETISQPFVDAIGVKADDIKKQEYFVETAKVSETGQ